MAPGVTGQRGAALLTSMFLVLVVLMLGVSAARAALNAEKSARFERDRQVAFFAAEAALADGERDVEGSAQAFPGRAALLGSWRTSLTSGCGRGIDDQGLCFAAPAAAIPVWQQVDLAADTDATVPYGAFSGARMPTGTGPLPARLPRYIIEPLADPAAAAHSGSVYRITAIGFGARVTTRIVLQSFYRQRPPPGQGAAPEQDGQPGDDPSAAGLTVGRIGWREVANWPELHAAATQLTVDSK
jgi:Tfp pilus assembly protein PilX